MFIGIAHIIVPLVREQELKDMLIQGISILSALLLLFFTTKN